MILRRKLTIRINLNDRINDKSCILNIIKEIRIYKRNIFDKL